MKKSIFGLAAIALLAVGCAENATVAENPIANPDAIGFELGTGKVTRATSIDLELLKASAGIGIYATNGATPSEFIDNKAYKYTSGTTNAWGWVDSYDSAWQDWPTTAAGYPVNFYAYYPFINTNFASPSDLTEAYTVDDNVANQIDYLAANKLAVNAKPTGGKVTLDFKHILSKIDFKVVTGDNVTVDVQSISVKNVSKEGTYNYANLSWSSWVQTYGSGYAYMTPTAKEFQTFDSTTATDVTPDNGSLLLMPQNLSSVAWGGTSTISGSYIEVVYRVYETVGGEDIVGYGKAQDHPDFASENHTGHNTTGTHPDSATEPLYVKAGYPLPTIWEQGKNYIYELYLGDPSKSGGQYIEDTFIDEDGVVTDLPIKDPNNEGGPDPDVPDPVYPDNNLIGFNVVVIDWTTATGIAL